MEIDAINIAVGTTKEIIAFATGLLALTATFAKDTFLAKAKSPPKALRVSWLLYLSAVFFWYLDADGVNRRGGVRERRGPEHKWQQRADSCYVDGA